MRTLDRNSAVRKKVERWKKRCVTGGRSRCVVEARVLRRWLFLWTIWMSASCLDQTPGAEGKEHKLFHLSCLHCGYSRSAVLKIWCLTSLPLPPRWMGKGEGTAGRREDKVVFHFCSGGIGPPQTITMLLHYHGNSSIGARDSKEKQFCSIRECRCLLLFLISWWRGARTEVEL